MEIEIIKAEIQEYNAGDIISIGNPHEIKHYLLINHVNGTALGAVNLKNGTLEYLYTTGSGLGEIVTDILKENEWNEWTLVPKDKVKLSLDCRNNNPISKDSSF